MSKKTVANKTAQKNNNSKPAAKSSVQKPAAKAERNAQTAEAQDTEKKGKEATKKAAKTESRVDQLYRKIGTENVYRIVQDEGGHHVRVLRVMPDGSTKGDEMVVNLRGFERVDAVTAPDTADNDAAGETAAASSSEKVFKHDPRVPPVGQVLKREYKGRILEVTVEPDGFSYEGKRWRSLTAIAREVTGISNPNGPDFFGLNGESKHRALDMGAVKFALTLLPTEYAPLREIDLNNLLTTHDVGACTDALERIEKARALLSDSSKALGAAVRVISARRTALETVAA